MGAMLKICFLRTTKSLHSEDPNGRELWTMKLKDIITNNLNSTNQNQFDIFPNPIQGMLNL